MGYLPGMLWIWRGCSSRRGSRLYGAICFNSPRWSFIRRARQRRDGEYGGYYCSDSLFYDYGDYSCRTRDDCRQSTDSQPLGNLYCCLHYPPRYLYGDIYSLYPSGAYRRSFNYWFSIPYIRYYFRGWVAESETWAPYFDYTGVQLTWMLVGYGFVAAVLPVWLLLAPRDYLSTFLKIGTIIGLAIGILILNPNLQMPSLTKFVDGTGPVWAGDLFPFLFITIACGAVSGFHALISSGTTPKMLANENQACFIGYGGMLMESFVAIMALVAACVIDPGVYFAMNSPIAMLAPAGTEDVVASAAQVVSSWGFQITPDQLTNIANEVGENSIISRAGELRHSPLVWLIFCMVLSAA